MLESADEQQGREPQDEMLCFMTKTLPCIINLALELKARDTRLPMKLKQPKYLNQSLTTQHGDIKIKGMHVNPFNQDHTETEIQFMYSLTGISVYELALQRSDVASLLAAMFLCLIPNKPSNLNRMYNICDYSEFFPALG